MKSILQQLDKTTLSPLDLTVFIGSLIAIMAIGLWAGRREETITDFYLAGKRTRWWGVAGSIFGSNVSANHLIGMMGVGFSVGFAQSHFEFTAIAGLLAMCYGFLPVYRKLNVFTLSEYLGRRYGESSRCMYAFIMIVIMVVIQMVPGLYIGSRSVNILLQGGPGEIDPNWYAAGILVMAVVTGTYTILGGLRAVIITDVIQSVLLLAAGIVVAVLTFSQADVGWWSGMVAQDTAGEQRLYLYLPASHSELPWTGVLSGLLVLHFFYWGTNQFIVQRALSARDDREARFGIIAAGFFKLLIPFFSIATGIAAYYMFANRGQEVAQDAVFTALLTELVSPIGYGLVGLVAAGMIGAILSSVDSMMNSAATIVTFDIYRRYWNPDASEKHLIWVGRVFIVLFIAGASVITIYTMDPNSEKSFFLLIASHSSKLVVGLVVAFALGMLWKRATSMGANVSIIGGVVIGFLLPHIYNQWLEVQPALADVFGKELNFLHNAFLTAIICLVLHVVTSLLTRSDPDKSQLTWGGLGIFSAGTIPRGALLLAFTLAIYAVLAAAMVYQDQLVSPTAAGLIAAAVTMGAFLRLALHAVRGQDKPLTVGSLLVEDRVWAGVLASLAVFMMYYFY